MASSASSAPAAARARAVMFPWLLGTPVAVTTMRSAGAGDLRTAWAMLGAGAELAAAATGAGFETGLTGAAGLAAAEAFTGAGFAAGLAATVFAAGFFAVNLGFSTFFALAGFAAARLVGMCCRSRPGSGKGGRFAGRGIIPAVSGLYSASQGLLLRTFFAGKSGQLHDRRRLPAILSTFHHHRGVDAATHVELSR